MSAITYDAFISYRHGDPDRAVAARLDEILRGSKLRVALDERDFRPEQSFLSEMARCVAESRFTLALLSRRYVESANTVEESVMTRSLGNSDRRQRLIVCYLEPCEPPLWLQNLVGIRLYEKNAAQHPISKLIQTLRSASEHGTASASEVAAAVNSWPKDLTALGVMAAGAAGAAGLIGAIFGNFRSASSGDNLAAGVEHHADHGGHGHHDVTDFDDDDDDDHDHLF